MKLLLLLIFSFPLFLSAQQIDLLEEHHTEDNETDGLIHLESFKTSKIAIASYRLDGSFDLYLL